MKFLYTFIWNLCLRKVSSLAKNSDVKIVKQRKEVSRGTEQRNNLKWCDTETQTCVQPKNKTGFKKRWGCMAGACCYRYLWNDEIWCRTAGLSDMSMNMKDYELSKHGYNTHHFKQSLYLMCQRSVLHDFASCCGSIHFSVFAGQARDFCVDTMVALK